MSIAYVTALTTVALVQNNTISIPCGTATGRFLVFSTQHANNSWSTLTLGGSALSVITQSGDNDHECFGIAIPDGTLEGNQDLVANYSTNPATAEGAVGTYAVLSGVEHGAAMADSIRDSEFIAAYTASWSGTLTGLTVGDECLTLGADYQRSTHTAINDTVEVTDGVRDGDTDGYSGNFTATGSSSTLGWSGCNFGFGTVLALKVAATATTYTQAVAATALGVATATATPTFVKSAAAAALGVASITKTVKKTLSAIAAPTASILKTVRKTLGIAALGVPTTSAGLLYLNSIAATAVAVVTTSPLQVLGVNIAAVAVGAVTISKTIKKTIGAAGAGSVSVVKGVGKTIAATAVGVATATPLQLYLQSVAATTVVSVVVSTAYIAGTGLTKLYRLMSEITSNMIRPVVRPLADAFKVKDE